MSNLSELIDNINDAQEDSNNLGGDILGTVADVSGNLGLIALGVNFVESLLPQDNQLQTVLATIQNDFNALSSQIAAGDKLARMRDVDQGINPALGVFEQLPAIMSQHPPPSSDFILTQIQTCIDSVQFFTDFDDKWQAVQADLPYYSDSWSGKLAPPAGDDGLVFNYTYTLPQFIRAIYIFLTTLGALAPTSLKLYTNVLTKCLNRLQFVRQTIVTSGIKLTRIPTMTDVGLIDTDFTPPYNLNWMSGDPDNPVYYPYGAVEIYSGASLVSSYMGDYFPYWGADLTTWWEPTANNFMNLLNFRFICKMKALYVQLGMPAIDEVISQLLILTGQPETTTPPYNAWPFAEVITQLGLTLPPPKRRPPPGAIVVEPPGLETALTTFLQATPPYEAFLVYGSDPTNPTYDPNNGTISIPPAPFPTGNLYTFLTGFPVQPPNRL